MKNFKNLLKGTSYIWLWNSTIFGGYCIFTMLFWILLTFPKIYRKIIDFIVTFWQFYVTLLLTHIYGCKFQITGDPVNSEETAILISNHRTRVDWNFLWPAMYHAVRGKNKFLYSTKFVLKNSIKNIPGAGWVMQLAFYIFIRRDWEKDRLIMKQYVNYVADMAYKHALILFPEGTDFTYKTKASSDRFAEAKGLTKYKHILHPRTTGFVYLVDEMRRNKCVDAIYDVTLIYPDVCPQNEAELFIEGKFPKQVMVHFVRYPISSLPDSKGGLKEFLEQRWSEKEKTIEEFRRTGRLLNGDVRVLNQSPSPILNIITLFFWLMFPLFVIFLMAKSYLFVITPVLHTIILIMLQWLPIGTQSFDMLLFNARKILFSWIRSIK